MWPNFEMQGSMCLGYIFFSFLQATSKKLSKKNFKDVQILYKNKSSRKMFPILLNIKTKYSTRPVKSMVHQLKITDLGDHLLQMIFIF